MDFLFVFGFLFFSFFFFSFLSFFIFFLFGYFYGVHGDHQRLPAAPPPSAAGVVEQVVDNGMLHVPVPPWFHLSLSLSLSLSSILRFFLNYFFFFSSYDILHSFAYWFRSRRFFFYFFFGLKQFFSFGKNSVKLGKSLVVRLTGPSLVGYLVLPSFPIH